MRIDIDERRARLGLRHWLARPAASVEEAAAGVFGLHSSDPGAVYLAARARTDGFTIADLEDALYTRRSLVRMLGMRRTLFVVPRDTAAAIRRGCAQPFAARERKRLVQMIEEHDVAEDVPAWLERVEAATLAALAARGEASAVELTKDVPELGVKLSFGAGTKWAGTVGVSTRVLFLLATEGRIVRARPLGTWISGQYRWSPTATWLGADLPDVDERDARTEVVTRWLARFGPATTEDVRWWTGWNLRHVREALDRAGAMTVALEGGNEGWVLADDLDPPTNVPRWVAMLPGLDPTIMGWKERAWYLAGHQPTLFDRNGNAGPTVWCDGRVVGGWAQRADGRVVVRLVESLPSDREDEIHAEADALTAWLDGTRVIPRFRTPFEKTLAAD